MKDALLCGVEKKEFVNPVWLLLVEGTSELDWRVLRELRSYAMWFPACIAVVKSWLVRCVVLRGLLVMDRRRVISSLVLALDTYMIAVKIMVIHR
jgi:hypothetical protein